MNLKINISDMFRNISLSFTLLLVIACLLTACDPTRGDGVRPIPVDKAPAITLIDPSNNNVLSKAGENVFFLYRLDDNEQLRLFRVTGQMYDQNGDMYGNEFIIKDTEVEGKSIFKALTYFVPSNLPLAYKIRFRAYAIDSKGEFSSTDSWVSVVQDPPIPPSNITGIYTNYKIYSKLAGGVQSMFKFSAAGYPANLQDADIAEISMAGFAAAITQPNYVNPEKFVITNSANFNFDNCNFNTLNQAFFASNNRLDQTPSLQVGDIVIMKLKPVANIPVRYATMRITSVVDDPNGDAGDYINFDFRYTY